MAIAPIDLQAIYAQMGHLAKVAGDQQNGPHLAQQLQEAKFIQQNAEKSQTVAKAAENESKTMVIGKDGRKRNDTPDQNPDEKKSQEGEDGQGARLEEIRESYLGNHINIST